MSDEKIIFSMSGVSKIYPPKKQVLKNIYLSFFYGAKIGVLGLNGAGKSSLLRIIAGQDTDYQGEVVFSPGYSVGMLEQEPSLDPDKTVKEVVEEGVAETVALLKKFEEINLKFSDPAVLDDPEAMQKVIDEQAVGSGQTRPRQRLGAGYPGWKKQWMPCALRPPTPKSARSRAGKNAASPSAACCWKLPTCCCSTNRTNHLDAESVQWLEQYLQQYAGTVIAVTHDRYFLDNVAGWILELDRGEGIPWKGNYSSWLEQKAKPPGEGRENGIETAENPAA